MKVIKTLEPVEKGAVKSIFLAGPTHRINTSKITVTEDGNDVPRSWRDDALRHFDDIKFDGVVYVPEWVNNEKPEGWTYQKQVEWEVEALNAADYIIFWIPRDMVKLPALTTNIEFGEWMHSGKIIVGAPSSAVKMDYIKTRCAMGEIPFMESLQDCVYAATSAVEEKVAHKSNIWFTSDTHFGQERTLTLSKRPFRDVAHMDQEMIRNWNSVVRDGDVVYHLGDFGDVGTALETVRQLNGANIFIVPGNYDKDDIMDELTKDPRVTILNSGETVTVGGVPMRLIHEPENIVGDDFFLFGHIHQLQLVKKGALNVGCDNFNYTPIDENTILFYYNAIQNHYDDNVFSNFRENQED
jgi:calcineurin-like phosphoesterase family protein